MGIYRCAVQLAVEQWLRSDATAGLVLMEYLDKMRSGFYGELLDVIGQRSDRAPNYDVYDAYAFALVNMARATGELVQTNIELSVTPKADKEVEENNRRLQQLQPLFTAKFYGGTADDDGFVEWTQPILACTPGKNEVWKVPKGQIRLEVGTTSPIRTLFHIRREGGIARWAYGSTKLVLLLSRVGEFALNIKRWPVKQPFPKGTRPTDGWVAEERTRDDQFLDRCALLLRDALTDDQRHVSSSRA